MSYCKPRKTPQGDNGSADCWQRNGEYPRVSSSRFRGEAFAQFLGHQRRVYVECQQTWFSLGFATADGNGCGIKETLPY